MLQKVKELRKELHQYPELSGVEVQTAKRIQYFIRLHHPEGVIHNLGSHGFAVSFEFSGDGPTIAIRCELDASIRSHSQSHNLIVHNFPTDHF